VGFTAYRLRARLIPAWQGAQARLVEAVVAIALLIWLGEILGTFGLFYDWIYVVASILVAAMAGALLPAGPVTAGNPPPPPVAKASSGTGPPTAPPAGPSVWAWVITFGVIALVFAHWGLTTKDALDRGIFNFDSLWYHMPFAADMVQSHSTTGLHYTETVFTNWFYPQNSELLHATGILLTHRDTLSLFLNFSFLGLAFLAAWCIGSPYRRGHLTVVAAAVVLECHTLVVREPGAAKNDLVAAALLLAAVAILVIAWEHRGSRASAKEALVPGGGTVGGPAPEDALATGGGGGSPAVTGPAGPSPLVWPIAAAGLAVGLAVGTKSTAVAMAAALTLAVVVLAPAGRRWITFGWWFVPALLGGGYWYLRNLIVAGNPLPQASGIGPIGLPHPERLQEGRPDFNIVHYATDTGVWRDYFEPGLHQAFGALWPLVIAAAIAGGLLALLRGREAILRWMGAVALLGLLAYVFTPLSAAGADGAPVGFGINIRYAIPPLLLGMVLLAAQPWLGGREPRQGRESSFWPRWGWEEWGLLVGLLLLLVITDRADAALRDPARTFGVPLALIVVVIPAALLFARARGAARGLVIGGFAALGLLLLTIGYPLQRDYLRDRFGPESEIPGMQLDSAYQWARDQSDARIGIVGTTAGFLQYGFFGTDLSNRVVYLGDKGPHGAYNATPTCAAFRTAVNAADLDYLVTSPFLNFISTSDPVPSPEARWLRGEPAVKPLLRSGPVTVWKVRGRLDPRGCGTANAPLREIPDTPGI
jgi:4-amino-4-deoxy-L-arabinose transferase-like glycosyltransferase